MNKRIIAELITMANDKKLTRVERMGAVEALKRRGVVVG